MARKLFVSWSSIKRCSESRTKVSREVDSLYNCNISPFSGMFVRLWLWLERLKNLCPNYSAKRDSSASKRTKFLSPARYTSSWMEFALLYGVDARWNFVSVQNRYPFVSFGRFCFERCGNIELSVPSERKISQVYCFCKQFAEREIVGGSRVSNLVETSVRNVETKWNKYCVI